MPIRLLAALLTAVAVALALAEGAMAAPSRPETAPVATAAATPTVEVHRSRYGRYLTDGTGRTLYLFARDPRGRTVCDGACARAWPPLIARGRLTAGRGARRSLLGRTRRPDGTRQVTYRGRPLYYYVNEHRPFQILCQDVFEFGGRWLLVAPSGRAIG
ncbi:MAG: hypothetical protein HZB46_05680 [Solirubrobacterales bacterium]|nr:hypothetical protein [Solirubrobacterales bacterium]